MMDLDAMIDVIRACGSRKILFGSGAPALGVDSYNRYMDAEKKIRKKFKDAGVENVFRANAEKIFHLR
jgi:predicted TIM-barrel fold metal-dependent hydrolase